MEHQPGQVREIYGLQLIMGLIHNTSFSSQLTNTPSELECLSLKNLLTLCNVTVAYWTHS